MEINDILTNQTHNDKIICFQKNNNLSSFNPSEDGSIEISDYLVNFEFVLINNKFKICYKEEENYPNENFLSSTNGKKLVFSKNNNLLFQYENNNIFCYINDVKVYINYKNDKMILSKIPLVIFIYLYVEESKFINYVSENNIIKINKYIIKNKYNFIEMDMINGQITVASSIFDNGCNSIILKNFLELGLNPNQIFTDNGSGYVFTMLSSLVLLICGVNQENFDTEEYFESLYLLINNDKTDINTQFLDILSHPYNIMYWQHENLISDEKYELFVPQYKKLAIILSSNKCNFDNLIHSKDYNNIKLFINNLLE